MKFKFQFILLFLSISFLSNAQFAGNYTTRFNEINNLELIIDSTNHYSLELVSLNGDESKTHLLSIGIAGQMEDTVFLKDKINGEEIKLVYTLERDRLKIMKGFDMLKARYFTKSENPVEDNYYNSRVVSAYELPKTGDVTTIAKGIFYTSDEKFCLTLQTGGNYIYTYDNMIISKGTWFQKKDELKLTDKDCGGEFIFKKLSSKELACKSMFGIIKFYDPHTKINSATVNHFYLQE